MAPGILLPCRGIEPMPPAMETLSLNHWKPREVPHSLFSWHKRPFPNHGSQTVYFKTQLSQPSKILSHAPLEKYSFLHWN